MKQWLLIGPLLLMSFLGMSQSIEKACFSVPGGFYEESPTLEIFPFYPQHHIRFTTNGNRPTAQSRLYTEPLLLDGSFYSTSDIYTIQISPDTLVYVPDSIQHCIVIRAAVFDENDSCISPVATNSYFIRSLGCDTHGLPVVSLCADSLDLFDFEHGIFVPGAFFDASDPQWTGNYYQSGEAWERWANIEFYELNNEGINQQTGLRTHGGNGRRFQQKCVKIYAREIYGNHRFEYPFFENIPQNSFKHLVLKPFVASWNYTGVNDHISNQIAAQLNVESPASRPVILYLNGEYWGIYYIHERPDERFLEDHLGVNIDQVNLITSWKADVACGSNEHFLDLFHWMETADLNRPEAYAYACSRIDMDSFIDYQIFELFSENTDWPANNMRCWQLDDGPWRWIFYDGDACFRWMTFYAFDNALYVGNAWWPSSTQSSLFFRKLLTNKQFCQAFESRFHELLDSDLDFLNTRPLFENIENAIAMEIPFQSSRFGCPESVELWNSKMGQTRWFLLRRCEYIVPVLEEYMNQWVSVDEFPMAFDVFPNPTSGSITLQIDAEQPNTTSCCVCDMAGRQMYIQMVSLDAGPNMVTLDLPLSPGIYLLKINDRVTKIVRQ